MELMLLGVINLIAVLLWGRSLSKILPTMTIERHTASNDGNGEPPLDTASISWNVQRWQQKEAA